MSRKVDLSNSSSDAEVETTLRKARSLSWSRTIGPVDEKHSDLVLLVCCLVTGMVDAASFSNYAVFVGMQTGNTVILGLSTSGLPANPYAWLTTLVSIATFLLGARTAFEASRLVTPNGVFSNRFWISSLIIIQGLFIAISAAIATPEHLVPRNPAGTDRDTPADAEILQNIKIVSLIPPLAFQSGMQIATSRLFGLNELPINVLTSTYCDLMGDFRLFALNNVKRNRRFAAVVLLLVGAISSGWLMRSEAGLKGVLWLAAAIKLLTGIGMFAFLPADKAALP